MIVNPNNPALSQDDYQSVFSVMESFLDNLDEYAIQELLGGNEKDVEKLLLAVAEETYQVISLNRTQFSKSSTEFLPHLTEGMEEHLRIQSFPFFITSCLPSFTLEWYHVEWASFLRYFRLINYLCSRGGGKSYMWCYAWPLWNMYRYKRPTNLIQPPLDIQRSRWGYIITNSYSLAKRWIEQIKTEVENNDILAKKILPGRGDSEAWGRELLRGKNGCMLDIGAAGQSLRGPHPTYIALDDFLDRSVLYSNEANNKFLEVFNGEIMPMLEPYGQAIVSGTPFTERDLYSTLKKTSTWKVFEYPALYPDGKLLSRRFSYEHLMSTKASLGTQLFSREILLRPITDSSSIFPWSILNTSTIGTQSVSMVHDINQSAIKFKRVVTGCDFAISANIGSDYSVFATVGEDMLGNYWLINLYRKQGASHQEQIAQLQTINQYLQPHSIVMETNGFQKIMGELAKQSGIQNVIEFKTTGFNKKDVYTGLPSLAVLFERGQMKMPQGDERSRQMVDLTLSEFSSISYNLDRGTLESVSEHDDICMAIFFAIQELRKNIQKQESTVWYL